MTSNEVMSILAKLRLDMLTLWRERQLMAEAETCCQTSGFLHAESTGIEQCIDLLHQTQNQVEKDLLMHD